jgi:hypothetical protein
MSKQRRTVLSGVVTPFAPPPAVAPSSGKKSARSLPRPGASPRRSTDRLPSARGDQLRELAFAERVKMHSLLMEGLDAIVR